MILEFPVAGAKESTGPLKVGIGTTELGFKFNFYNNEHKGLYASLYPQIEFAVPGSDAVEKGVAEPGQTFILPLLVQKELKYLTLVVNLALSNRFMILNATPRGHWALVWGALSPGTCRSWVRFTRLPRLISRGNDWWL